MLNNTARKSGVARYLQISTDEVYGSLGATGKFSEASPLAPNSPYAASKTSADLLVRAYGETFGLPVLVTRCSNNYGPYQFPEKLIPFFVTLLREGKPVPVYGDGKDERSMKFVPDRPGHDRRYAIDDAKIRAELGVVPRVPFEEGLRATVRWYLDNEPWWRAVQSGEYQSFYDRWYVRKDRA